MNYPINVFIDTNYFIGIKFEFDKGELKSLIEHCESERINLFTSEIVISEVEKHIKTDIGLALSNIRNEIKRNGRLLSIKNKKEYSFLFQDIRKIGIVDSVLKDFESFRTATNCQMIEISDVNPIVIFEKYFGKQAPFGSGDKKAEFPDAFMIEAIKNRKFEGEVIIISNDNDWKKSFECTDVKVVDGINHLITKINKDVFAEKFDATMSFISEPKFKEQVMKDMSDEIYNLSVDVEKIVDTIEILNVNVKAHKFESADYIDSDTVEMTFLVNADITIEYTYFDEENSVYDTVDHEYVYQHTAEVTEIHGVGLEMTVILDINDDLKNLELDFNTVELNEDSFVFDDDSLIERTRNDVEEPFGSYFDLEDNLVGDTDSKNELMTCPDCGREYDLNNDGGNGFCSECGPEH